MNHLNANPKTGLTFLEPLNVITMYKNISLSSSKSKACSLLKPSCILKRQ